MRKIGAVFRSYSKKPEGVDEVVSRALKSAKVACELTRDGQSLFEAVICLIPLDYDCGQMAERLRAAFSAQRLRAEVLEARGHHSGEVLNVAARSLTERRIEYVAYLSNKALPYLTRENIVRATNETIRDSNIRVVGVLIEELEDVMEMPIQNTFAIWHISALMRVGGFDSQIGVEEVAPVSRILQKYGRSWLGRKQPCVALLRPRTSAKLDIRQSADGQARHAEVRSTKRERQEQEAARVGVTLEWINKHIAVV